MLKYILYYIIANILDVVSTLLGLHYEWHPEGNPIIVRFMKCGTVAGLLFYKIVMLSIIIVFVYYMVDHGKKGYARVALSLGIVVTMLAVIGWYL